MTFSVSHLTIRFSAIFLIGAILVGPFYSVPNYDWISNTLSELAGQGMPNAWIMRSGFIVYGCSAFTAAILESPKRPATHFAVAFFGAAMILVGLFSVKPIAPIIDFDPLEDAVHSFFASAAGIGFILACSSRLFLQSGSLRDWLSWLGFTSSIGIPLFMRACPHADGLPQRLMFLISIIWMWREFKPRTDGPIEQ